MKRPDIRRADKRQFDASSRLIGNNLSVALPHKFRCHIIGKVVIPSEIRRFYLPFPGIRVAPANPTGIWLPSGHVEAEGKDKTIRVLKKIHRITPWRNSWPRGSA